MGRGINAGICQPPFSHRRIEPPPRSGQGGKGDVLYGPWYSPHFLLSTKGSGFPDSARITEPREPKEGNVCCAGGGRGGKEKEGRAKLVLFVLPIIDEFTGREEGLTSRNFFDGKKHPRDENFLSFSFRFSMPEKEKNSRFFF